MFVSDGGNLSFENSTSQKVLEILQTITKQQQCHFEEHHVVAAQAQISEVAEGEEAVDLVVVEAGVDSGKETMVLQTLC